MSLGTTETFDLGRTLRLRLQEANEQRERTQVSLCYVIRIFFKIIESSMMHTFPPCLFMVNHHYCVM